MVSVKNACTLQYSTFTLKHMVYKYCVHEVRGMEKTNRLAFRHWPGEGGRDGGGDRGGAF